MSVDLYVTAFRPPDNQWQKMHDVWKVCVDAGVPIPQEVVEFFDGVPPDPSGVEVELKEAKQDWSDEHRSGYQIDLSKLPPHIKYIRAYLS